MFGINAGAAIIPPAMPAEFFIKVLRCIGFIVVVLLKSYSLVVEITIMAEHGCNSGLFSLQQG